MRSSVDYMCLTVLLVTVSGRLHDDSYLGSNGDVTVLNAFVWFILILVPLEYRRGYLMDS